MDQLKTVRAIWLPHPEDEERDLRFLVPDGITDQEADRKAAEVVQQVEQDLGPDIDTEFREVGIIERMIALGFPLIEDIPGPGWIE